MTALYLKKSFSLCLILFFYLSLPACFSKQNQDRLLINGAGASFPYILYSKWLSEYHKVNPLVAVNYQSIGSGGGIRQFITGTLDFGGTDVPVSKEELSSTKKKILHIPTTLSAVVVVYNIKINKEIDLRLSANILSRIFRGKINKWNDPELQKMNPNLKFPDQDIVVIYRADGSGTTSFFTEFLALASKDFLKEVGKGKSVPFPVGVGGKGNEGVMGLVNKIEGAISYIGMSYAATQNLPVATIQNKSGRFIKPNLNSLQAAANQAMKRKKSYTTSFINIQGKTAYPLTGFSYIIISQKMQKKKGSAIVQFLKWTLNQGQSFSKPLHFISLPDTVRQSALNQLAQVEFE